MKNYPAAIMFHQENNVEFHAFLVRASSEAEAFGKAMLAGSTIQSSDSKLKGWNVIARVGDPDSIVDDPSETRLVYSK